MVWNRLSRKVLSTSDRARQQVPAGETRVAGSVIEALEDRRYCADTAGNNPASARNLGAITSVTKTVPELVSSADADDFYKFSIGSAGNTTVRIDGLTSNANLQLYNAAGTTLLAQSTLTGTAADQVVKSLAAGTYMARVKWVGPASASYNLKLTGPAAAIDPGSTAATAKVLGNIGTAVVNFSDSINTTTDKVDFYKITTTAKGLLKIKVIDTAYADGMVSNVSFALYAANGTTLITDQPGSSTGVGGVNIIYHGGPAATYYIKVYGVYSSFTSIAYKLQVSNPAVPADTAGSTRATAKTLALGGTNSGFIVSTYNQDDWYKTTVTASVMSPVELEFRANGATRYSPNGSAAYNDLRIAIVDASGKILDSGVVGTYFGGDIISCLVQSTQVIYVHVYQATVGANGPSSPYSF